MSMAPGEPTIEQYGYKQELKRSLSFWDLMIYGLIFMVPIAPFGIFGSVYQSSGGMVALAYIIGGIGMAFTAASYAQMSRAFPMSGSVYTYAGRGIAGPVGFIGGWMILLDYILVPALLYIVAGAAMNSFVPGIPIWGWVIFFILLNTGINYFGIELTARVNKFLLVAELVVLAIFLVIGIWALANGKGVGFSAIPFYDGRTFSVGIVFTATSIAVLSFLGFDAISTLAEENKEDVRSIGRAMIGALVLAGLLFIVQTWVAALLVPDRHVLLTKGDLAGTAFYNAAAVAGGHWLLVLTAVATAVAWGFANALVAQAATSRLLFAMARDRQLPAFLRQVHPTYRVPENATFLIAAVSIGVGVYMASRADGITLLSTMVNFGALTAFILLHLSVISHFVVRGHDWAPQHWLVPLIGILILGYVLWSANLAAQTIGLVWLALGIIFAVSLRLAGRKLEMPDVPEEMEGSRP